MTRALPPRNVAPNPNPPIGTVGPNVPAGYGDTHVMYPAASPPIEAQAWDGWPVEWAVPSNLTGTAAAAVSTVFAAIDLNARIIASLPAYTTADGRVEDPQPRWVWNPAPGLYADWADAMKQMIWSYQAAGEIFLWALTRYADDTVAHFVVLNPDGVYVTRGEDGYPQYSYQLTSDEALAAGVDELSVLRFDRGDICHIPYTRVPGALRGTSPLAAAAGNVVTATAAAKYGQDLTNRGGIPWAVLNAPYELTGDEVDAVRSQWTDAAARRNGAPAITSGGFTLETLTISPREMALLELLEFNEARIAIILGVQPYQMGLPQGQGLTYQSAIMVYDYHWRSTLRPFTRDIAAAISQWAFNGRRRALRFNPDQYVRPGIDDRVNTYEKLVAMGVMTADEVRLAEDLEGPATTSAGNVLYGSET